MGMARIVNPKGDEPSGNPPRRNRQHTTKALHAPAIANRSLRTRLPLHLSSEHAIRALSNPNGKPASLRIMDDLKPQTARHNAIRRGGACRDRTDDPLLAKQMLSQLS
jgi:hypothetical protein